MAQSSKKLLLLLPLAVIVILLTLSSTTMAARALSTPSSELDLAARLDSFENSTNGCWESLTQLQSCTGEVIQFFYNGEASLGMGCCHAIYVIQHNCWPAMLGALGFTSQESDILRGYCDAEEQPSPSSSTTLLH